jgi:hypothetical protein
LQSYVCPRHEFALSEQWKHINLPPFHVWFDIQQVLEPDPPRLTRGGLQHEPAEFGMENWRGIGMAPDLVNVAPFNGW